MHVLVAALSAFALSAGLTQGAGTPAPDNHGTRDKTSIVQVGGPMAPSLVLGGSAGCYGQTDTPHASGHVPGTVNVVARTVCPTTDYVLTDLYRQHWYGWEYMSSGSRTAYGWAQTNAAGTCAIGSNFLYEGDSYHEGTGAGQASTYNNQDITCP